MNCVEFLTFYEKKTKNTFDTPSGVFIRFTTLLLFIGLGIITPGVVHMDTIIFINLNLKFELIDGLHFALDNIFV